MTQRTDVPNTQDNGPARRRWHAPEFRIMDVGSTQSGQTSFSDTPGMPSDHHS
jgi:hypothetical protein